MLRQLFVSSTLPWCTMGDFNNLLALSENRGGALYPNWLLTGFREAITYCHLFYLGLFGGHFTWERHRGTDAWVEERLDRGFANMNWQRIFQ